MSEMVERVAKALWTQAGYFGDWDSTDWIKGPSPYFREQFRAQARAAIEAMREPTHVMLSRGNTAAQDYGLGRSPELGVWRAMIDEALK